MALHNPHALSPRERQFIRGLLDGLSPSRACVEAGFAKQNLPSLVRRLAVRWQELQRVISS